MASRRLRQQPATSLKSKICTPSWSSYTSSALLCPRGGVDHLLSRCSRASRTMLEEDIGGGRYHDARRSTFRDGCGFALENHGSPGSQGERGAHPDPDCRDDRGAESIIVSRNVEAIQFGGSRKRPWNQSKTLNRPWNPGENSPTRVSVATGRLSCHGGQHVVFLRCKT